MKFVKRQVRKVKRKIKRRVKRFVMGMVETIIREKVKAGALLVGLLILKDLMA